MVMLFKLFQTTIMERENNKFPPCNNTCRINATSPTVLTSPLLTVGLGGAKAAGEPNSPKASPHISMACKSE